MKVLVLQYLFKLGETKNTENSETYIQKDMEIEKLYVRIH